MKAMTNPASGSGLRNLKMATLAIGSAFLIAGCAGNPPTEQFALTESAINRAVSADATQYSAVEMKSAQDKWKKAEMAMHDEEFDKARKLAEQAEWDARLAERKAMAAKAEKAVSDAEQGIRELRDEGMRSAQ
ncbi:DUF4398 domain-containing protein [Pseudomonas matsuisoli]|uniref:Chromosome segregation ATPase n=1 Tax=Pseudomonas matsuisoli TaxID=1515666 RepID=A0A917USL4_9PSED|nr:DUF4398 domain-containing protein [Pseudomonas matsuisoli]GGJ82093.1 chromosome segregation ATPase [Pseudomonas matsuisoli]